MTIAAEGLDNRKKMVMFPQLYYGCVSGSDLGCCKKEVKYSVFKQVFACTKSIYMIDRRCAAGNGSVMNVAKDEGGKKLYYFPGKELVRETEIKSEHLKVEVLKRQQRHVVQSFRWR